MNANETMLTAADVAVRLNVSRQYVLSLCRANKIRHLRLGPKTIRITEAQLVEYLGRHNSSGEVGDG